MMSAVSLISCGRQFPADQYAALRENARWDYDGPIRSIEVTHIIPNVPSEEQTSYVLFVSGITGVPVQATLHQYRRRIYLDQLDFSAQGNSILRFEPPLPVTPSTGRIGDREIIESTEIRGGDSSAAEGLTPAIRIRMQITVVKPIPMTINERIIKDILRIRVQYAYVNAFPIGMEGLDGKGPLLAGESQWWFGRNIGLIRYEVGPYGVGSLVSFSVQE
jgi:hypothetical protein